jgi:hypothetical protein
MVETNNDITIIAELTSLIKAKAKKSILYKNYRAL